MVKEDLNNDNVFGRDDSLPPADSDDEDFMTKGNQSTFKKQGSDGADSLEDSLAMGKPDFDGNALSKMYTIMIMAPPESREGEIYHVIDLRDLIINNINSINIERHYQVAKN